MLNDTTVRGTNFTCVHTGPKENWTEFRLEPPDVPMPARGKLFLRSLLGSSGLEMSLNVVHREVIVAHPFLSSALLPQPARYEDTAEDTPGQHHQVGQQAPAAFLRHRGSLRQGEPGATSWVGSPVAASGRYSMPVPSACRPGR